MKSLENQSCIRSKNFYNKLIYFNKVRLGACLSFGKTIVALALIKTNNIPIERDSYSVPSHDDSYITAKIIRKYYVDTTLIIVSQSVFHQWVEHANKCNLNILMIESINDFNTLCTMFINDKKSLSQYDAIIMIYKPIRSGLPYGTIDGVNTTINVIASLSINTNWKRLIIDDFDTINIKHEITIPARMTWCISTTSHRINTRYHYNGVMNIHSITPRIMDITKDPLLNHLTIKADLDIASKIIPRINVEVYTFLFACLMNRIINSMEYSDEVIERINSGDISGAANSLGITVKCESSGEFLSCVLEKNKTSYYESIHTCRRFEDILKHIKDNEICVDNGWETMVLHDFYDKVASATEEQFKEIKDSLIIKRDDVRHIEHLHSRAKANVTRSSNVLERLKRNIDGGECQKCLLEPEGNRYILKCCDIILCEECITTTNDSFIYKCPNCIQDIQKNSVIQVPSSLSLEQFLEYDINNAMLDIENYHKNKKDDREESNKYNTDPDRHLPPKTRALINIITNKSVEYKNKDTKVGLRLQGVSESNREVEKKPNKVNKFLVFVKWATCANELHAILADRGIKSIVLRGTSKTIKKLLDTFKTSDDVNVMFMYSTAYCAGLNLEFATHMIFHHSILDSSIHKQLIGRAQRLGRTESLKLIYLRHKGERYI
jgi:hypothetical protein